MREEGQEGTGGEKDGETWGERGRTDSERTDGEQ